MEISPFRFIRHAGRAGEIGAVLVSFGFGDVIERVGLKKYVRWGKRHLLRREEEPDLSTAQRLRIVCEQLGPTFIKFGQVLSTRRDLLPEDVIHELSHLQEDVPPFPGEEAVQMIEEELNSPIDRFFSDFEKIPLAAGSLGQVHRATLKDGTKVAVKVRRPQVVQEVERDLALLSEAAPLFASIPQFAVFDPVGLVSHFARTIRREMNFRREGRTLEEFAKLFRKDATLYVPKVYSDLTTEAVLTMEFIEGCRIDDLEAIRARGLSPAELARNGAQIFMKQVFEFGMFHGDPHPGNIRIHRDGAIVLLDYGMIGILEETMRDRIVDLFVAVVRNQVDQAVWIIQEIGHPRQQLDPVLLKADVHDFIDRYYGIPLEQLRISDLFSDFFTIMANHALQCPPDLMLLLRAFITLEGLGRVLDPSFNLAAELAPFIERILRQRHDPRRLVSRAVDDLLTLLKAAHDLPLSLSRTLRKLGDDDLKIQLEHRGLDRLIHEFDRSSNRVVVGLITSSLVVASALVIRTESTSLWVTVPIFLLSGFLGIWLIYGILRSGRL